MTEQESAEPEKEKPQLPEDEDGYFPIMKFLKSSRDDQGVDLVLKNCKAIRAGSLISQTIQKEAKGGGEIMIAIGAKVWKVELVFDDAELGGEKKKSSIIMP